MSARPMSAEVTAGEPAAIPAGAQHWVLAGLLGAVALNVQHIAAWALPLAAGATAWRVWAAQRPARLLRRPWRLAVLVVLTLAVLISFRTLNGLDAGASLLVAMMALKLMETQRLRDWLIVLGGALFLLLAACLAAQAFWLTPLYAAELWLLSTALYALGAGDRLPPSTALMRNAARSLLLALPLALLLFLFFPRLAGALWSVPRDDEAVTGLSDTMSPGSISNLVDSDEPALRIRFDGPLPPRQQRYWRGPILHLFDGNTWSRVHSNLGEPTELEYAGLAYRYEVTLEPNSHGVLIALDLPRRVLDQPRALLETFDHQFLSAAPIANALSYRAESYLQHHALEPLPEPVRELDLALPATRNPRARELAHSLRAAAGDDRGYVQAVLGYLQDNSFEYTRTPPPLGRNAIDDLLFRTHAGFCGHYASAFAMLMRAGGIPAHVVTGYLGGQLNRFGGYLLVKQANAHAWTEVWLDGAGWVRVDPTAVIDAAGLDDDFDEAGAGLGVSGPGSRSARWIANTLQAWQAVNAWWQDEFINFNANRQLNLLGRLGFKERDYQTLITVLAVGAALWLSFLAWRGHGAPDRGTRDSLGRSWRRLERALRHRAGARAPHEGPVAYGERIANERPEFGATLRPLTRQYAQLRYGPQYSLADQSRFDRAVRLFTARLRRHPVRATAARPR